MTRTPLTPDELTAALTDLPGWTVEGTTLVREFTFRNFRQAFAFMTQVAFWAEKLDHHPDWSNSWSRVRIALCTHDAGRQITGKDVELAGKINAIAPAG